MADLSCFITSENYSEKMKSVVEPYLAQRGGDKYFTSFSGGNIHYLSYRADNPVGGVVISHGFTESAEKFLEMIYYYLNAGLNVYAIDHRGHGKSLREGTDKDFVYIDVFDDYIKDFRKLVKEIATPANEGLPLYLYAHSMGGAVGTMYLQEYGCDCFDKAVLTAPMIYCNTADMPHWLTGALCGCLSKIGAADRMVPGGSRFNPDRTWENSNATCKERFDYWQAKRVANVEYQVSVGTNRWVYEAVRICPLMLDDRRCGNIDIPILLCQAEEDRSVVSSYHDVFVAKLPKGKLVKFPGSRHEIYLSGDETLKKYLEEIFTFLGV